MEKQDYSINQISMIFQNMDKCGIRLTKSELDLCEECTNGSLCKLLYNPCPAKLVYTKLSQYEDTGLTPEEVQKMRWIPVEERLPEPTENPVLVHDYSGVSVAWHSKAMGWVYKTGFACVDVTHWMPLPQPPKEEKNEENTNII